ncbi:MAG: adenylyltransferase/cytidyltransferase family protein [Methanobrevibacter sp.]|nr:adenylyltransferase/cytidyltransferase family protein [Methanobrevibacter sp.]
MKKVMASGTFDLLHPGHGIYLQEAKNLGGYNSKLFVVVARDSTVEKRKRVPIVGENQRLELIKMLKPVDEAYLGNEDGNIFKIVEEINPDIIAIGPDQTHNVDKLQKAIDDRGLKARVQRVSVYHQDELDSSCKIIKKIKNIDFEGKILDNCE